MTSNQADQLSQPLNSHEPIADRLTTITRHLNRNQLAYLLLALNRNSVQDTCVHNIKSIVIDGVCESMLVAILTPAVSCDRVISQSGPCRQAS